MLENCVKTRRNGLNIVEFAGRFPFYLLDEPSSCLCSDGVQLETSGDSDDDTIEHSHAPGCFRRSLVPLSFMRLLPVPVGTSWMALTLSWFSDGIANLFRFS